MVTPWKHLEAFKGTLTFPRARGSAYPVAPCPLAPKRGSCTPPPPPPPAEPLPAGLARRRAAKRALAPSASPRPRRADAAPAAPFGPQLLPRLRSSDRRCRPRFERGLLHPSSPAPRRCSVGTLCRLQDTRTATARLGDKGPAEGKGCQQPHRQPCGSAKEGEGWGAEGPSGKDSDDKECRQGQ